MGKYVLFSARSATEYCHSDDEGDVELDALDPSGFDNTKASSEESDDASIRSRHGLTTCKQDDLESEYAGAALMEGVVAVWDKRGKYCFIAGLALLIIVLCANLNCPMRGVPAD